MLLSALAQLSACLIVWNFHIPNPNILLFVVLSAVLVKYGYAAGIVSGLIAFLYSAFFFSTDHSFFLYTSLNFQKLIVIGLGIAANILLIGRLQWQFEHSSMEKMQAEAEEKLQETTESYRAKLYHDVLTGTYNRRYYEDLFSVDGSINAMLGTSLNWLGSNSLFQPLLILTDTWKEFGYGSIVYLAAITSIDSTLYEAASIDGATWWKKVWHVTLPGIRTTIVLMAVMNLGNILNAGFDQVYNLYSASVYATGDILDTYVYRVGLQGLQYSFGTAVGLLKSVIAFVLMIGANKLAQKYTDSKIF